MQRDLGRQPVRWYHYKYQETTDLVVTNSRAFLPQKCRQACG